ncbi:hypothetical protein EZV73_19085 [Acidaminobacter sp. JC074]|uniref:hypothetical protein n=1 Tax=Acidaminobacter sp. JC074 TaxID=2530199 RepID=UPI001F0FECFD|nr:hypothetical protein [Acidaminobacter sp. JC074]MCH4889695.1 hypothetical protein [Acidaminobacter sp. JC074]
MKDDKFTFVNDVDSDVIDPSDMIQKNIDFDIDSDEPKFEFVSEEERSERIKLVRTIIIMIIAAGGIFAFALFWQDSTSLLAICNAVWLVSILFFFMGWMMLMSNMNILSPLVYGAKSFAKMIMGKGMATDYYTYVQLKEENPIPGFYYKSCFIGAVISGIPAIILLFIARA